MNNSNNNTNNTQTEPSQPLNNINQPSGVNQTLVNPTLNPNTISEPTINLNPNINNNISPQSNINQPVNNINQPSGVNQTLVNPTLNPNTISEPTINPNSNINNISSQPNISQPMNNINHPSGVNQTLVNPTLNQNTISEPTINPNSNINNNIPPQSNINQPVNNINQPVNNINHPSGVNQIPVNPTLNPNTISEPAINPNPNINNISPQPNSNDNLSSDDELLKAFIGNNYEKITTRPFNFAGFFFTTFYMFYRKMFLYGLLIFLISFAILNFINNFIVTIVFCILIGFLVNKIYLYYAHKQISKIKVKNSDKDLNELKNICARKGGTSIGKIFLGFIIELFIAFLVGIISIFIGFSSAITQFFNPDNWNVTDTNTNDSSTKKGTLVENVSVGGYFCFGNKCTVTINKSNNTSDYSLNVDNPDLFTSLKDYKDYIKLDIYYTQKGDEKTIVNYKIYLKSNNEDITSVKTEDKLRNKIGLYSEGTFTDTFTLKKIGDTGGGIKDNQQYTYTTYIFVDSKNNEYEMKSINQQLNVVEGNKYTVTFECTKESFDYDFIIKSIN